MVLRVNLTGQHLYRLCETMGEIDRRPVLRNGHTVLASASIGIARFPDHGNNENDIQANAVVALKACKDNESWSSRVDRVRPIAFNVPPGLLTDPDSFMQMLSLIDDRCLARHCIILEITEDCILHRDSDAVPEFLQSLVDQGYQLSLDDFGTGFASLTSLKEIPSSENKVDRSFALDIAESPESESIEQLIVLKQQNCKVGQGYLFSKAVCVEEISLLLGDPMPYASQIRQAELTASEPAVAWRLVR